MRTVKKRFEIRAARVRSKISKVSDGIRLCVTKSNKHVYAQIIDDNLSKTLVSFSTVNKDVRSDKNNCNKNQASIVGKMIAELAKKIGIMKVVFDRGGYKYHGVVKALADACREGGLQF